MAAQGQLTTAAQTGRYEAMTMPPDDPGLDDDEEEIYPPAYRYSAQPPR
jgi:hypothetical protein